jgi:hypothetical protein
MVLGNAEEWLEMEGEWAFLYRWNGLLELN